MERVVQRVETSVPQAPRLKNVAAYVRVSDGKDAMLHSMAAQVSYFSEFIQHRPSWRFAGVYADEAITGTKDSRAEFQRLLADCRAGKIDLVLTKSISPPCARTIRRTISNPRPDPLAFVVK